jgi:hypothetical protein
VSPRVHVEGGGSGAVFRAGAVLLVETFRKTGLNGAMSVALAPWRKPRAVQDPGKILLDLAPAVALGGDCLADMASDPTISRLIDILAAPGEKALQAIRRTVRSPWPGLVVGRRAHPGRRRSGHSLPNPGRPATFHRPDDNLTRPGQWNPAPTRRDSRATGLPTISSGKRKGPPTPSADPRERSRLAVAACPGSDHKGSRIR